MTTNKEHEEASLRARLAADARDVDAMSMLALTIAERYGSAEESKVMLNKALEIDPRNPKTLCSVAEFTLKYLGDEKAATDRVNEAVALVLRKADDSVSASEPASVSATAASAAASAVVTTASGPHPNKHVVLRFAAQYFAEREALKEDSDQNGIAEMYFREAASFPLLFVQHRQLLKKEKLNSRNSVSACLSIDRRTLRELLAILAPLPP